MCRIFNDRKRPTPSSRADPEDPTEGGLQEARSPEAGCIHDNEAFWDVLRSRHQSVWRLLRMQFDDLKHFTSPKVMVLRKIPAESAIKMQLPIVTEPFVTYVFEHNFYSIYTKQASSSRGRSNMDNKSILFFNILLNCRSPHACAHELLSLLDLLTLYRVLDVVPESFNLPS